MKNFKNVLTAFLSVSLVSQLAFAECEPAPEIQDRSKYRLNLQSSAFYEINSRHFRGDDDAYTPTIIASISKVLVTQWALHALPGNHLHRFRMELFVSPVGGGKHNVHIAGHHYPTFDRDKLNSIFDFLRTKGVTRIAQLSFDENTKYIDDWTAQNSRAIQGDDMDYPSYRDMSVALSSYKRRTPRNSYESFVIIPSTLYSSTQMAFMFVPGGPKRYITQSPPAIAILHRMNERSNNHVANEIFSYLGGSAAYVRYAASQFSCGPRRRCNNTFIKMNNGSGSPLRYNGRDVMRNGEKVYNKAPGAVIVQALTYIYHYMRGVHLKLSDVMSVNDNSGTYNHLGRYAAKCYLEGNVAAKTGSVFKAIALAGYLSTREKGPIAFYMNVRTDDKTDWPGAKHEIRAYLTGITNLYGEGVPFD